MTRKLKFSLTRFSQILWSGLPILGNKTVSFLWYKKDIFHMGILSAFQKKKKGQNVLLTSAVFQVPLTQSRPYARAAYFGVLF